MVKTLSQWLQADGRSLADLARALGRSPHTVEKYLYGERKPSCDVIARLEILTDGQVRAQSFVDGCRRPARAVS